MIVDTVVQTIGGLSYAGVFLFSLMANMLMPVPEEVFILVIGYLGGLGVVKLWISGLLIFLGLSISDMILYHLSRGAGRIVSFLRRKLVGNSENKSLEIFRPHINKFIFFSRFFVGFRWIGPVLAGSLSVSRKQFFTYNSFALLIYIPGMLYLGYFFRNKIQELLTHTDSVKYIVLLAVGVFVLLLISQRIGKYMFKKARSMFTGNFSLLSKKLSSKVLEKIDTENIEE